MRYALISDIHSNLEALGAALDFLADEKIDEYLCIGDVVGYGADPQASIRLVRSLAPRALIAGNHDWGVLGLLDSGYFNEYARKTVAWTTEKLKKRDLDYLKTFSLMFEADDFTIVHGSLERPKEFNYILTTGDARATASLMKRPICFVGHTHVAGIFYLDGGIIKYTRGPMVKVDRRKKYIVNVGSLGQPRDSDPRASFAIYDVAESTIEIKRVEYDVKKAQDKILAAGLPSFLASRLAYGR